MRKGLQLRCLEDVTARRVSHIDGYQFCISAWTPGGTTPGPILAIITSRCETVAFGLPLLIVLEATPTRHGRSDYTIQVNHGQ
mgnify:CR=1 FL=1